MLTMDLFLLKKVISAAIMPLSVIIILLLVALIFYKKAPRISFKCLLAGTLLLILTSFPPFADWVMAPLEDKYPAFTHSEKAIDFIIILGCSHTTDAALPITSQLKVCSLQRLVEALRIYQIHPEATIITSGGTYRQQPSNAEAVKQAAISLNIPENKIIIENLPRDTEEEAQLISPRVTGSNVVLITNTDHMPRSMRYFQENGVNPIAAPVGYWVKGLDQEKSWNYYLPNIYKLEQTTTAWYECLGLFWQSLKEISGYEQTTGNS